MSEQPKDSVMFTKGMVKDVSPIFNTEGQYTHALNMVNSTIDGDKVSLTTEEGNMPCNDETEGYIRVGAVGTSSGLTILFSVSRNQNISIISIQDPKSCSVRTILRSTCLNFKPHHQIDAIARVVRGCENVIYFTDNHNPYRSINIDRLELYTNPGYTVDTANNDPANGWNCRKINHFLSFNVPTVDISDIYDTGGRLRTGAYQFTIRYLDANLNSTNWIMITNPVTIIEDSYQNLYDFIAGAKPYTLQDENYTTKSVEIALTNVDTDFLYYEIGVIESSFGTKQIRFCYVSDRQLISNSSHTFLFTGFNELEYRLTTVSEFNVDSLYINTVEAHQQIDNRLLLANATTYDYDWATLQRCTLLTKTYFKFKNNEEAEGEGGTRTGFKYATVSFDKKQFMTDEVYAFGLMFVFKNGLKSPVFHIPGRNPDVDYDGNDIQTLAVSQAEQLTYNTHPRRFGIVNQWDTQLLEVLHDGAITNYDTQIGVSNVEHIPINEFIGTNADVTTLTKSITFSPVGPSSPGTIEVLGMSAGDSAWIRVRYEGLPETTHYVSFASNTFTLNVSGVQSFQFLISYSTNNGLGGYTESSMFFPSESSNVLRTSTYSRLGLLIPRWKVFNTAVFLPNIATQLNHAKSGLLAYHQNNQSFYNPNIVDCSGISIWDSTMYGGPNLAGTNIRHHKMPDLSSNGTATILPNSSGVTPFGIGRTEVVFDLTDVYNNIPSNILDEIQGYYIVVGNKDRTNKTIIDKGYTISASSRLENNEFWAVHSKVFWDGGDLGITQSNLEIASNNYRDSDTPIAYNEFISNEVIYNSSVQDSGYVKVEHAKMAYLSKEIPDKWFYNNLGEYNANVTFDFRSNVTAPNSARVQLPTSQIGVNRVISGSFIVNHGIDSAPVSSINPAYRINNGGGRQRAAFVVTKRKMQPPACEFPSRTFVRDRYHLGTVADNNNISYINDREIRMWYVSIKLYRDVHTNLNNIKYIKTHNNMFTFNGVSNEYAFVSEGDVFHTTTRYLKTQGIRVGSDEQGFNGGTAYAMFPIESNINSALRHAQSIRDRFYPRHYNANDYFWIYGRYNKNVLLELTDNTDVNSYGEYRYTYNNDYSKQNVESIYLALDETYDYCNKCNSREPFTIYYSEKSTNEDKSDNYKVILPLNYTTIPGDTGVITNLFIEKDQLYCHTERALWAMQTRPQEIQTNEDTLYVGTGAFLSIPPKRLVSIDYGYAGSIDKFATIGTQFGTFFIDSEAGKVFMLGGEGLKDLSLKGMQQWFFDNLPIKFNHIVSNRLNIKYGIRHTVDGNSVGFISWYDPMHVRILLHKRDFDFVNDISIELLVDDTVSGNVDTLYYNVINTIDGTITDYYVEWYYYDDILNKYIRTDLNDVRFFVNNSWTISYSFEWDCWLSFHSYLPNFAYNDRDSFYTSIINRQFDPNNNFSSVWKHNTRNYLNFYGINMPSMIELLFNPASIQEKISNTIQYLSNAYEYMNDDDRLVELENVTFNSFYAYNNYQITNERVLVVKTPNSYIDITLPLEQSIVDRTDNNWRISRYRDLAINRNNTNVRGLTTSNWSLRKDYYTTNGQGYIDQVVNPNAININKSLYEQARMKDKYLKVRLIYVNQSNRNIKLVTHLGSIANKPAIR